MRVSLFVLGKVTKHGVLMCINKKVAHVFHREGSYRPPPPGWIGLKSHGTAQIQLYSKSNNIIITVFIEGIIGFYGVLVDKFSKYVFFFIRKIY